MRKVMGLHARVSLQADRQTAEIFCSAVILFTYSKEVMFIERVWELNVNYCFQKCKMNLPA
jgi:hypothetical protein